MVVCWDLNDTYPILLCGGSLERMFDELSEHDDRIPVDTLVDIAGLGGKTVLDAVCVTSLRLSAACRICTRHI